jgi:hypothetical protein
MFNRKVFMARGFPLDFFNILSEAGAMKQWIAVALESADHRLNTGSNARPAGLDH